MATLVPTAKVAKIVFSLTTALWLKIDLLSNRILQGLRSGMLDRVSCVRLYTQRITLGTG